MTLRDEHGNFLELTFGAIYADTTEREMLVRASAYGLGVAISTTAFRHTLQTLYDELKKCYDELCGTVWIPEWNWDRDLTLKLQFDGGNVTVSLTAKSMRSAFNNTCSLSFCTDQTFVRPFLNELYAELKRDS